MVADLFPRLAYVGSLYVYRKPKDESFKKIDYHTYPAEHALVSHDTNGEKIDRLRVVLATHDFWGHVARRAGCILSVIFTPDTSNTKISDAHIAVDVDDEIFGLDIPVDNLLLMEILETRHQASNKEA